MSRISRRTAFTLIELLTVIAIITLLIGILTPSLGRARDEAKKASIKAQLGAIETGLEMFRSDQDQYPASNAALYGGDTAGGMQNWLVGNPGAPLQGAHLIVDAMVGRDFLGYDPKPNNQQANYARWDTGNSRRAPYIDPAGIDTTTSNELAEDAFAIIQPARSANPILNNGNRDIFSPVFKDKFGWPILYYRANKNATQLTPILGSQYSGNIPMQPGVYNGRDNDVFTDHPNGAQATLSTPHHLINQASLPLTSLGDPALNNFADFIRSFRSSTVDPNNSSNDHMRPVNSETFLLITPGKDGIYGNLDDVGNFAVKDQR